MNWLQKFILKKVLGLEIDNLNNHTYLFAKKDLRFMNKSPHQDPSFAKEGDSGFDMRAWIKMSDQNAVFDEKEKDYTITLQPLQRQLIHTGIYLEIPEYCEIQVRPRSGFSLKKGGSLANCVATIDEGYVGEIGIILVNLSNEPLTITNGDRIAQSILMPVFNSKLTNLVKTNKLLKQTKRGGTGFGSSGMK